MRCVVPPPSRSLGVRLFEDLNRCENVNGIAIPKVASKFEATQYHSQQTLWSGQHSCYGDPTWPRRADGHGQYKTNPGPTNLKWCFAWRDFGNPNPAHGA